jgi:hypothetical protein
MSSEKLWQILFPPENIPVLFGLVLVFGGRLFVALTDYTFKVDPVTAQKLTRDNAHRNDAQRQQAAKEALTVYTHDSIWRVSLVSSILSSFVSLFVMVSTRSVLSYFLFMAVIVVLLLVLLFLHQNQHPNNAREPYSNRRFLRWLNPYWAGDLGVAAFQMILFAANSLRAC